MKLIYCLLLLLCPYLSMGQSPIRPGDKVPEIAFTRLLNSKANTIKLSQLKGKLVILDFWATWCSNCIKKFNLLDSLQQQHAGKLQVILVSNQKGRDTKEKIEAYLNNHVNAAGKKYGLPAVYDDSIASKYFPHSSLPYYVWIDPDGKCLALTGSEELTAENIQTTLAGGKPDISGRALMEGFDFDKPLFTDGNGGDGKGMLARSSISRFIPGMAPIARYSRNAQRLTTQYKLINQPLLELLKKGYGTDSRTDRIIFKVADSVQKILQPATAADKRANSYTYELLCPPIPYADALKLVQEDLQRYFGLYARWEELPADCYELSTDSMKVQACRSKGGNNLNKLYDPDNKYLQSGNLASLAEYLNYSMKRYVNLQAELPYLLDIKLPELPPGDDEALVQALAAMGIILKPVTAVKSQFVIYQTVKKLL